MQMDVPLAKLFEEFSLTNKMCCGRKQIEKEFLACSLDCYSIPRSSYNK